MSETRQLITATLKLCHIKVFNVNLPTEIIKENILLKKDFA